MNPPATTQMSAFKRWFIGSRVVDTDGAPLVVYHGTGVLFSCFDLSKCGSVTETSDSFLGIWTTASFGRAHIAAEEAKAVLESSACYVMPLSLRVCNPLVVPTIWEMDPSSSARIIRRAKAAGHDGVHFVEGEDGYPDYLVFEPTQIKSATRNTGQFDPLNADIYS